MRKQTPSRATCPDCGNDLGYAGSIGPAGFYKPGDPFDGQLNDHYSCRSCFSRFRRASDGQLMLMKSGEIVIAQAMQRAEQNMEWLAGELPPQ